MLRTRALALLTALGCAAATLTACERSATAPLAPRASVAPAASGSLAATQEAAATSALVDAQGGLLQLSASQDYPLYSTLTVPAGVLDAPAYFDVVREVTPDVLVLRVSARPARDLAAVGPMQNFTDEPIVLALRNTGSDLRTLSVVFSPPDGGDPVAVEVSLEAGQNTTLEYRRGRSKYSVIIF